MTSSAGAIGAMGTIGSQASFATRHITGSGGAGRAGGPPRGGHGGPNMDTVLAPVADLLGTTTANLQTSMRSGQTLDSLADAAGVSHDDLVAAITAGIDQDRSTQGLGGATPTGEVFDVSAIAEAMATGVAPAGGPSGPPPPPPVHGVNSADDDLLQSVASALDLSTDDLVSALMDGTSLSDLATRQGVSMTTVLDTLGRGMVVNTTM